MTLDPVLAAPSMIQAHAAAATLALILGPLALYRNRRDALHKLAGYAWVTAMAATALTGLMLPAAVLHLYLGFGPIHILALWALVVLYRGVAAARSGRIARHRAMFRDLYWTGLAVAGLFTMLPGRVLNKALFGPNEEAGWIAIGIVLLVLAIRSLRAHLRGPIASD